ncbi:hypothetical protein DFH29DRAFT_1007547 [Suillus ampliporus]|nr:hypothetical protein DFH29DRAFT_1007547 [Suillus ampliporus]
MSGGSQRASSASPGPQGQALVPPQAGRSRGHSLLSSDARLSTHSGPTVGHRPVSSNSQSRVVHSQGRQLSSTSDFQVLLTITSPCPVSPAGSSDIDQPISMDVNAGVQHRRDSSADPMQLTPRRTKQLKMYAQQLATDHRVPLKKLLAFIEELEKLLTSKDFESALKGHLTACMLSPNLTAYVTDTQQHIMDFIKEHSDLFKISEGLFDDTELRALLGKLVMQLLATIHGSIKTTLTTSVSKKLSIMDALKLIIHSGMEVDSSHWTRFAFLRCLRMFLIGVSDHKKVALQDLFSPYLIPSLHPDLQHHIMSQLHSHPDLAFGHQDGSPADSEEDVDPNADVVADADIDADVDADTDGINDDSTDSGFRLQGSPAKWNKQKFWNYIDTMLEQVHESAHHEMGARSGSRYEDAYRNPAEATTTKPQPRLDQHITVINQQVHYKPSK